MEPLLGPNSKVIPVTRTLGPAMRPKQRPLLWPNSTATLLAKLWGHSCNQPSKAQHVPIHGPLVWPGSGTTIVSKSRGHSCDKTLRALMWPTLKPLVRPDTGATLVAKLGKVPPAANLEGHTCGQIMRSHCDQTCHFVCHSYGQTLAPLLRPPVRSLLRSLSSNATPSSNRRPLNSGATLAANL